MKKIVFCLLMALSSSVNAGKIRSAVDVTVSSEIGVAFDIGNTIDQSELLASFDLFDTFLESNPDDITRAIGFERIPKENIESASIEFGLGLVLGGFSLTDNSAEYRGTKIELIAVNASYFQNDFDKCSSLGCSLKNIVFSTENISVSTVPVPTGSWLLGSGLIGFIGMRKKASQVSEVA